MAVAMPVRNPKQSASPAATLYSPPETWTSNLRALRKGTRPGSRRWTSAPRERKSNAHGSCRIGKPLMTAPHKTFLMQRTLERRLVVHHPSRCPGFRPPLEAQQVGNTVVGSDLTESLTECA